MNSSTQNINSKPGHKLSQKWKVIILFTTIIIAGLIGYFFLAQQNQLSKEDFTAIEQRMDSIYANMNLKDIDKVKVCYHYEDSMGKVLKCEVEMAGYVSIKNPDDLPALTKKFSDGLKSISTTSDIWRTNPGSDEPTQNASFSVKDSKLTMGCLASIGTKDGDVSLGRDLPERDLANKAVLVLSCGGGSSKPYFDIQ